MALRSTSLLFASILGALLLAAAPGPADAQVHPDCRSAEADIAGRLRALLDRRDSRAPWIYGGVISSVRMARAMCAGARPERGLRLYQQIGRALETEVASVQESRAPF
jgi:hypothetical protein